MKYRSFRIRNFKGIKETTVNFSSAIGSQVYALVGLNESGKTTILEAIYSFSPDSATSDVVGGDRGIGVPIKQRVPRHQLSTFTGDVEVSATLEVTADDWKKIHKELAADGKLEIQFAVSLSEITFQRLQRFKNGDFVTSFFTLLGSYKVRSTNERKWRPPNAEEKVTVRDTIYGFTPDIAYFPTFVLNFPEKFYLSDRGNSLDTFYRSVFQDILDFDGKGHTICTRTVIT